MNFKNEEVKKATDQHKKSGGKPTEDQGERAVQSKVNADRLGEQIVGSKEYMPKEKEEKL